MGWYGTTDLQDTDPLLARLLLTVVTIYGKIRQLMPRGCNDFSGDASVMNELTALRTHPATERADTMEDTE